MSRIIKLVYINLLKLFHINQIIIAREDGVRSNFENKSLLTCLILLFYGYIIYQVLIKLNISNNIILLGVGYFISTIICLFINITSIEPLIFKNNDNEMLFSMPLSLKEILFSKLFSIYLKNLIAVAIIMISCLLAYIYKVGSITDIFGLFYLLNCLIIPFIPIIVSSIISYSYDYLKVKSNNNVIFKLSKYFILFVLLILIIFITLKIDFSNLEVTINHITNIYLFTYIFTYSLEYESIMAFLASIGIPILFLYLYYEVVSNNYIRICSMLKGIKKKISFQYKKTRNNRCVLGIFRKDITYLFQNNTYLISSYGSLVGFSFALFFALRAIDISKFSNIPFFDIYFNSYLPPILAVLVTFTNSAICSFSLEQDNYKVLSTMPISLEKILLGKWLVNIVIGSIFIIINGLMTIIFLNLSKIETVFCFLLPFFALSFVSFTSLILDLIFAERAQTDTNAIIKQRLLNIVPAGLALLIGLLPILLPITEHYYFTLGSYILAMVLGLIIEYIYFKIKKGIIIRNLLK